MIRHIVLMKCKPDAARHDIDAMFAALAALTQSIPGVLACEGSANNSPEGLNHGYTHAFTMDFVDEATRAAYLPHPEHKHAQTFMQTVLTDLPDKVLVLDFSIENSETRELYQTS